MLKGDRVEALLSSALQEMDLLGKMSEKIESPEDFGKTMDGFIVFRACGMSLQYITESFVKIKNAVGDILFKDYPEIPWKHIIGMRNFLSHEYGDVDEEAIFNTIKEDIPTLKEVTKRMLEAVRAGEYNTY